MLYILLFIIAVGVLLASKAGQELLGWLIMLAVIGGVLYLLFWLAVFGVAFFNSDAGKDAWETTQFILGIGVLVLIGYYITLWIGKAWTDRGEIASDLKKVGPKMRQEISEGWENFDSKSIPAKLWKEHKAWTIFFIIIYSGIGFVVVWAFLE